MAVTCSTRSARSSRFSVRRESPPKSPRLSSLPASCSAQADMSRKRVLTDYIRDVRTPLQLLRGPGPGSHARRSDERRCRDSCHRRRSRRQWSPWRGSTRCAGSARLRPSWQGRTTSPDWPSPPTSESRLTSLYQRMERSCRSARFVEDGGARLKQLLSRLRAGGMTTFRFPKVHPAEISKELLQTLGFRPAGGHLTVRSERAVRLAGPALRY